jgi:predicted nucleic-acid-binding Zn-ribbon protein
MSQTKQLRCQKCGQTASVGDDWGTVTHPTLGSMTQCPECGSTNIQAKR